jgi:sugar phosphate isomerase/epimerase
VYVACSSVCFEKYALDHTLRTIHELRFAKVDLTIREGGPHLRVDEILDDVNRVATRLRATNTSFAAFHLDMPGQTFDTQRDWLRAACRLGRLLTVPLVSIDAAPAGSDFDAEVKRLQTLERLASGEGITLAVTTHCETMTADKVGAVELCRRVPGLALALDPSHYIFGSHGSDDFDLVYPFVKHVRVRDSKRDKLQVRVGQGELEYGKMIHQLVRHRYDRALCVDIHPVSGQDFAMEPEVRKLKYLLESMI